MLAALEDFRNLLRCPRTGEPLEWIEGGLAAPGRSPSFYPLVGGVPLLVDFDRSVIDRSAASTIGVASGVKRKRRSGLSKTLKSLVSPAKRSTRDNMVLFNRMIHQQSQTPLVLVIGGGTVGQGMAALYEDSSTRILAFDIYHTPEVHFIADAHTIPLADASVDAVVVQAVLEHVLQPSTVVAEIWRVLRPGGLVYAETPFLQHVHEGPYDFTRFTESGHRYLFRRFDLVCSGASGGPGTQLLWSIDYFFRSLFRSVAAGKAAKLAFFWLRHFDSVIPSSYASDAASGVYFLGFKSTADMSPLDAVAFYRGAQR